MQDLATLNEAELTSLSPEVISRQATINIGALRAAAILLSLDFTVVCLDVVTSGLGMCCLWQAPLGTWRTANLRWSRPFPAFT